MTNPVIPILLSLAGAIAVFVFLLSDRKYAHLPKWAQVLADVLNFKHLLLEAILRFAYVFATVYCIVGGLFTACGKYTLVPGLVMMFIMPIVVRLIFETAMLMFVLVKNVVQINQKLPGKIEKQETFGDAMKDIWKQTEEAIAEKRAREAAEAKDIKE